MNIKLGLRDDVYCLHLRIKKRVFGAGSLEVCLKNYINNRWQKMIERSLKLSKDYPKKMDKDNTKKNAKIFMLGFCQFIKLISNRKTSHENSHQSIF